MMCVWGSGEVSFSGSSLRPMMGVETGALGHELCGASVQPTLSTARRQSQHRADRRGGGTGRAYFSYSASSKMRWGSRSTVIAKPLSMSFLAVVGVNAARCSNSFVSHRSQSWGAR